jgi:hypothetical protein
LFPFLEEALREGDTALKRQAVLTLPDLGEQRVALVPTLFEAMETLPGDVRVLGLAILDGLGMAGLVEFRQILEVDELTES